MVPCYGSPGKLMQQPRNLCLQAVLSRNVIGKAHQCGDAVTEEGMAEGFWYPITGLSSFLSLCSPLPLWPTGTPKNKSQTTVQFISLPLRANQQCLPLQLCCFFTIFSICCCCPCQVVSLFKNSYFFFI